VLVLAHHHISEQWHSDQAGNAFGSSTTNVDADWLLNAEPENLLAESIWPDSSEPFLRFEHWLGGVGGLQDYGLLKNTSSNGGINVHDVSNSNPNEEFLGEPYFSAICVTQQQFGHSPTELVDILPPHESLHSNASPDAERSIRLQESRFSVSEVPYQPEPTQYGGGALGPIDLFPVPLSSLASQTGAYMALEVQMEPKSMADASLGELLGTLCPVASSQESSTASQGWSCDFHKCGRICESRKKLR